MESWEFLIQKEGDRTWLPLESPEVEILEGRYRMVARCSRPNENIEITVCHETIDEIPPKRRLQRRTRTSNPEGLIVILPYTRLKPGIWEFSCTGVDIISDSSGNNWHRSVQLEVLSVDEESMPLTPEGTSLEVEMPDLGDIEKVISLEERTTLKPFEGEIKQQPQEEIEKKSITQGGNDQDSEFSASSRSAFFEPKNQKLQLSLNHTSYIGGQGQPVIITGTILGESEEPLSGYQIHIQLRDPQISRILAEVSLDIASTVPPIPFSCGLNIPPNAETRLILGEVKLYSNSSQIIDSKPFTITADLGDLFDEIVEQLSDQEYVDLSSEPFDKRLGEVLDQSYQELLETIDRSQPISFEPAPNTVLPPLLNKPKTLKSNTPKPLDLPSLPRFGSSPPRQRPSVTPTPQAVPEPTSEGPVELEEEEISLEIPANEESLTPEPAKGEPETVVKSPLDEAFQSLNLPDRFWSRLNALAADEELSEILKADLPKPAQKETNLELEKPSRPKTAQEWDYQEFVIEDEPTALMPKKPQPVEPEEEPGLILPKDEPVPVPVLELPKDALIAGRTVKIKIRLPDIQPRIYVKVWLQDRSARLILDGPYWVTDFMPSVWGGKEGTVQLMIPYGSFEIQFQAIAMEMQTQRESYKISISREVTPPSPPSLPLE